MFNRIGSGDYCKKNYGKAGQAATVPHSLEAEQLPVFPSKLTYVSIDIYPLCNMKH
jgi:hypothetical protein